MNKAAALVKEARRRAGVTQAELAERLGTPQSVVARWESGQRVPSLASIERVARACGLDTSIGLVIHDTHDLLLARQLDPLSPGERIEYMVDAARQVSDLVDSARPVT